jgi:hypothetical protein
VVALRALVTFFLTREEASVGHWQYQREFLEQLRRGAEEAGNASMASYTQKQLNYLPALEAAWREAVRRWNDLCAHELSDAALAEWELAAEFASKGSTYLQPGVRPYSMR